MMIHSNVSCKGHVFLISNTSENISCDISSGRSMALFENTTTPGSLRVHKKAQGGDRAALQNNDALAAQREFNVAAALDLIAVLDQPSLTRQLAQHVVAQLAAP